MGVGTHVHVHQLTIPEDWIDEVERDEDGYMVIHLNTWYG